MPPEDTSRRITVKAVLRGVKRGMRTEIEIEKQTFYFTGEPSADGWPGVALRRGDLEAIAWTSKTVADELTVKLRARADVVAVSLV